MKLDKITDCVNKTNPKFNSPHFWDGYRAFVYGGKFYTYDKKTRYAYGWGGIEPFDWLSDQAKDDWRAGIAYGRKERKECRKL